MFCFAVHPLAFGALAGLGRAAFLSGYRHPGYQLPQAFQRIEDVAFVGRVREARLLPSALSGKVAGVPFTGLVALNLRGE